jgi:hypothetical protein
MKTALQRRFFVVIHTVTLEIGGLVHALAQATVAQENGADGIFLIPDYAKGRELKATALDQLLYTKVLCEKLPNFLIGVNFLCNISGIARDISLLRPNMLQIDGASVWGLRKEQLPHTELFCGVAFKYSGNEDLTGEELREHCSIVAAVCDVPTTSGKATGYSAHIGKIKEIASYLPDGKRLGIASGVDLENVEDYLNAGVTDFLVATSLVTGVDEFKRDVLNPELVAALAEKIHSYN